MSWYENLTEDPGWTRPYIDEQEGLTPKRINTLRTKIVEKKLLCASNGNIYIFLPTLNTWSILCSDESTIFLNSIMEMESATVNYDKAFRPFVSYLERRAVENLSQKIPTSVCIGTSRLRVNLTADGLSLGECESVLTGLPSHGSRSQISALCYMPIAVARWPRHWVKTDDMPMYTFIAPLFPDPRELLTIEWVIGNALLDPSTQSKAVILYGEGGTGKSTLLAAIKIALMGCCGSIPDRALLGLGRGMNNDVASVVVSNRIVTAGDVGGIDDSTNLSVIKSLTGHDYISIPPLSARSACSLFYATNRLDDPRKNREWSTAAIMRRVIVVLMNADALQYVESSIPQDAVSRLDFSMRCIHTRLSYPHVPVTPMSVILTLMGSLSTDIFEYITETTEDDVSDDEAIAAIGIIAGALVITSDVAGDLARKISPSSVKLVRTMYCIIGIRPTSKYYNLL